MTTTLNAAKREGTGKGVARKLRQAGRVPAVLYGKDMEAVHLTVDAKEALHLFQHISVENTIVALAVEGEKEPHQTLVREIQAHPFKNELIHVDFLRVQAGVEVDVEVPVELIGTPVGVKQHGGVLEQIIHELPVRCIPSMIPEVFEVDVSALDVNDAIHVSDLTFGEGVEVTIPLDRTVCSVAIPRVVETEEPEEEAEDLLEPELVGEDGERAGEDEADEGGDED